MKKIFVVRHCAATGQAADAPLTEEGCEQAKQLASFLTDKEIELIVSSPYLRAVETIQPFSQLAKVPIQTDGRLAERVLSGGHLDNWLECLERTFQDFDLAFDGGETSRAAMKRATGVIDEILSWDASDASMGLSAWDASHGSDRSTIASTSNVVLVTHGNLMTLLLKSFDTRFGFQEWAQLSNPDVYLVSLYGTNHQTHHGPEEGRGHGTGKATVTKAIDIRVNRIWGQR